MDNKSDKKSNSAAIIASICVIGIIAIGYFYIYPNVDSLKKINTDVEAKIAEISKYQDNISALNILKNQYSQISTQLSKLGLAVPADADMPDLLTQVEYMANSSGMKLNSIQPGKETAKGVVPVTINLKGDFTGLNNFVTMLEKNIRPAGIKTINITSVSGEESLLNITLNIDMLKSGGTSE
jgi:Tfp pilus assembly protein PilO